MSYSDPTIAEQRAADSQSQNDANQTTQSTTGNGAVISSSSSARTSLGGGGSSGGSGGGSGGGGGYSAGASLANTQTQSLGFSGAVTGGNKGFLNFGDFNANLGGGKQSNGLSATTLAILAGAAALILLVLGRKH